MLVVASYRAWSHHEQMMTPAEHQHKLVNIAIEELTHIVENLWNVWVVMRVPYARRASREQQRGVVSCCDAEQLRGSGPPEDDFHSRVSPTAESATQMRRSLWVCSTANDDVGARGGRFVIDGSVARVGARLKTWMDFLFSLLSRVKIKPGKPKVGKDVGYGVAQERRRWRGTGEVKTAQALALRRCKGWCQGL